jgi:orotate phosphoribosyltransferase
VPVRCSTRWFDVHELWRNPFASGLILQNIAEKLPGEIKNEVQIVAGPPTGGYAMARDLARYISSNRPLDHPNVDCAPIDKAGDAYQIRPYYKKRMKYRKVILTDDVRWEGDTFNACVGEIIGAGAHLIAVVFIIDCCIAIQTKEDGLPIFALQLEDPGPVYFQADCPKCRAGEPITEL